MEMNVSRRSTWLNIADFHILFWFDQIILPECVRSVKKRVHTVIVCQAIIFSASVSGFVPQ